MHTHNVFFSAICSLLSLSSLFCFENPVFAENGRPVEERLGKPSSPLMPDKTVFLYPHGQKAKRGLKEAGSPLLSNRLSGPEKAEGNGFIANVSDSARIDLYFPEKPNGQMIVICPGGSYFDLSSWNEGIYTAKWLTERGIAACVLKYRLPNGHWQVPLTDVQNTFRYCRAHASEWKIKQLGIMGFSAGGHLASTAETMYDDMTTKPDFAILIYPVISMEDGLTHYRTHKDLLGSNESWTARDGYSFEKWYERQQRHRELEKMYSTYNDVSPSTPATFIALSSDDRTVSAMNSVLFYKALIKNKVPAEMHIFPRGGHGWGFTTNDLGKDRLGYARNEFSGDLERWLSEIRGTETDERSVQSAQKKFYSSKPERTVFLYPYGQNSDKGLEEAKGPGESNGDKGKEKITGNWNLTNVGDSARFDMYIAPNPNGLMVIICPGGCYVFSAQKTEGFNAAAWLLSKGTSVCIMKYRMPHGHWEVPLTDVQNAFRYCRAHAVELGVRKIGVMGFSAGGHLAASASTLFTDTATRPDFSILFYPVISMKAGITHRQSRDELLGRTSAWSDIEEMKKLEKRYSLENEVSAKTPETFIALCSDDGAVPPENSLLYYEALLRNNVPAEMHIFPKGGHGWGFDAPGTRGYKLGYCENDLLMSLERFLKGVEKKK